MCGTECTLMSAQALRHFTPTFTPTLPDERPDSLSAPRLLHCQQRRRARIAARALAAPSAESFALRLHRREQPLVGVEERCNVDTCRLAARGHANESGKYSALTAERRGGQGRGRGHAVVVEAVIVVVIVAAPLRPANTHKR